MSDNVIPLQPKSELPTDPAEKEMVLVLMGRYREIFGHVKDAVVGSLNAMQLGINVDVLAEHCHQATAKIMDLEKKIEEGKV